MSRDLGRYEKDYMKQPFEPIQKDLRKKQILNWLDRNKLNNQRILEIGCADDSLFNHLSNFDSFYVIEPSKEFYQKALIDKGFQESKKIQIFNNYLEDVSLSNTEFDVIIISCLLHEIPKQEAFLNSLKNIARPNTLVYIDVPNAFSFHRLLAKELGFIQTVFDKSEAQIKFQQNEIFSQEKLKELLERCGFEILEEGSFSFKPFTHSQMQNLIDTKAFTEDFIRGLSRMTKYVPELGSEIFTVVKYGK